MNIKPKIEIDQDHIDKLLNTTCDQAVRYLKSLPDRKAASTIDTGKLLKSQLPEKGMGAENALAKFENTFQNQLSASAGSRYFGFVTGGSTPAAIAGDWLVSAFDQNTLLAGDSIAPYIELETIEFLKSLFGLPNEFTGCFVTGATMANVAGLAIARQYLGKQLSHDIAQEGLSSIPPIKVISSTIHSSSLKAMSLIGIGRDSLIHVPSLPGRESIDVELLIEALNKYKNHPTIVLANAGTVNTGDFDDLIRINQLKQNFPFWLHVDAAFGGFAAVSPKSSNLVRGIEDADSITIDGHKWLNVPYDSGMIFTKHLDLQIEVFKNVSNYLPPPSPHPANYLHLTPENSRRFRALPAWMSLMAYGRDGYREMIENCCDMAKFFGKKIKESDEFELLSEVRLNIVCFTLRKGLEKESTIQFLRKMQENGVAFLTPTNYQGKPAMRVAVSNWKTRISDMEKTFQSMIECAQ